MKRIVKIKAENIKSKYGLVIEEDENCVVVKVGNKKDRLEVFGNMLILGKNLIEEL